MCLISIFEKDVLAFPQHQLALGGRGVLPGHISHVIFEEAVRVLLPLDEFHVQLIFLEPVVGWQLDASLVGEGERVLVWDVAEDSATGKAVACARIPGDSFGSKAFVSLYI